MRSGACRSPALAVATTTVSIYLELLSWTLHIAYSKDTLIINYGCSRPVGRKHFDLMAENLNSTTEFTTAVARYSARPVSRALWRKLLL